MLPLPSPLPGVDLLEIPCWSSLDLWLGLGLLDWGVGLLHQPRGVPPLPPWLIVHRQNLVKLLHMRVYFLEVVTVHYWVHNTLHERCKL